MILINSGAYVIPEFQAEIGKLPPCLLPVANKKLIEHQVRSLNEFFGESIYVTLPSDYQITKDEEQIFIDLNIQVIKTSIDYTLAEAVLYVLNTINFNDRESIRLLHGDTLLENYPYNHLDCLGLGSARNGYIWEYEDVCSQNDGMEAWCGYFSFSDKSLLVRNLALSGGDFITAVRSYNDFKSLKPYIFERWYDFGHINTYFQSRAKLTTERAFNHLEINNSILSKTGQPSEKIKAEALWFENLPPRLKVYTPQLLTHGEINDDYSYNIEYLSIMPLNELFVHGKKTARNWGFIFDKVFDFLSLSTELSDHHEGSIDLDRDFKELVVDKTLARISQYSKEHNFDLNSPLILNGLPSPSINQIVKACIEQIMHLKPLHGIIHGDLCLSNILFDSRSEQIKLIDPRGLNSRGLPTIVGDQKYDLAKLGHSVIGLYDLIISERFNYSEKSAYEFELNFHIHDELLEIQKTLLEYSLKEVSIKDVMPLIILLFISMLPLHNDRLDRQKAMLANAVRLYNI